MPHPDLAPDDLGVFSQALVDYFHTATGQAARVCAAYPLATGAERLWNDFNGLITLSGGWRGTVCFCAPRAMLAQVLHLAGVPDHGDERHSDIVGEIACLLSGSARRHFGESLEVSVPAAYHRWAGAPAALLRGDARRSLAVPLEWNGHRADLVIQLERGGATA